MTTILPDVQKQTATATAAIAIATAAIATATATAKVKVKQPVAKMAKKELFLSQKAKTMRPKLKSHHQNEDLVDSKATRFSKRTVTLPLRTMIMMMMMMTITMMRRMTRMYIQLMLLKSQHFQKKLLCISMKLPKVSLNFRSI